MTIRLHCWATKRLCFLPERLIGSPWSPWISDIRIILTLSWSHPVFSTNIWLSPFLEKEQKGSYLFLSIKIGIWICAQRPGFEMSNLSYLLLGFQAGPKKRLGRREPVYPHPQVKCSSSLSLTRASREILEDKIKVWCSGLTQWVLCELCIPWLGFESVQFEIRYISQMSASSLTGVYKFQC